MSTLFSPSDSSELEQTSEPCLHTGHISGPGGLEGQGGPSRGEMGVAIGIHTTATIGNPCCLAG